ncbi:hypothetical protein FB45DRAFT_905963 [Roridomyces roridus]|uniref:Uncharacterized protein n=1 Tax=Roridomyces roridus TaxID=1738132 RepID=A0AAD7FUK1_9AGAR|nr:hypothetical protein FB45DRAFT_905963 [Roridomyces roridus]
MRQATTKPNVARAGTNVLLLAVAGISVLGVGTSSMKAKISSWAAWELDAIWCRTWARMMWSNTNATGISDASDTGRGLRVARTSSKDGVSSWGLMP